jgi:signal transduction histidine kinase
MTIASLIQVWRRWIEVESSDPEDARRRRLLNILLTGVLAVVLLLPVTILLMPHHVGDSMRGLLTTVFVVWLVASGAIYLINRYGPGWLASTLFLLLLTVVLAAADFPEEIVNGRSLFFLVIPILMASVLLQPYASFLMSGVVTILLVGISLANDIPPNLIAVLGFFVIALVSWLSARSLERALYDLGQINQQLDLRVVERTRDLTEALKREQNESSKNQAILTSIADGVVFFDESGRVLVANEALAQLLDRPQHDLIWQTLEELMQHDVPADDQAALLALRDHPQSKAEKLEVQWGQRVLSITFATVRTENNSAIGSVMVCRDFTREAELNALKDRFLSMTSHELRTPLNAILGYTDMVQAGVHGPLNHKQDEAVTRINANAKRMLSLVNNILDQAQLEAGTFQVQLSQFSLHSLVEETEHVTGVLAQHRGLTLDFDIAADMPELVYSDMRRLSQVLLNLIGNALKFTKEGGVTVQIYTLGASQWGFSVSDTGVGIPPEAHSTIFEPFRQADNPITRETSGSGLGLSIVKQIVTLLAGDITLERSRLGEGSTFSIVLPLHTAIDDSESTQPTTVKTELIS